jgi:hypothetical protein
MSIFLSKHIQDASFTKLKLHFLINVQLVQTSKERNQKCLCFLPTTRHHFYPILRCLRNTSNFLSLVSAGAVIKRSFCAFICSLSPIHCIAHLPIEDVEFVFKIKAKTLYFLLIKKMSS